MPSADDVESVRDEFAETLDAIEGKFDLKRRASGGVARARSLAEEQPVPVAAIAVAAVAVVALAIVIGYRIARR